MDNCVSQRSNGDPLTWCCDDEAKVRKCVGAAYGKTEVMAEQQGGSPTGNLTKVRAIRLYRDINNGDAFDSSTNFETNGPATRMICASAPCTQVDAMTEGYTDGDYANGAAASSEAKSALAIDLAYEKKLTVKECSSEELTNTMLSSFGCDDSNCTQTEKDSAEEQCKAYDVTKECKLRFGDQSGGTVDETKIVDLMTNEGTQGECAML